MATDDRHDDAHNPFANHPANGGHSSAGPLVSNQWDPADAVKALAQEAQVMDYSWEQLTQKTLKEAAPGAAQALIYLALNSTNEPVRLRAATAVLDRALGRVSEDGLTKAATEDLLRKTLEGITKVGAYTPTSPLAVDTSDNTDDFDVSNNVGIGSSSREDEDEA